MSDLDRLLRALADPTRRQLLATIAREPGLTTAELVSGTDSMSRWGVMKHLAVLEEAGLVQSMPEGRHRRHFHEPQALDPLRSWLAAQSADGQPETISSSAAGQPSP